MYKLRRVDIERSQEIFSKIERYKEIIIQKLRPDLIMLFGSFARRDFNEGSDVDLLVVANFRENFLDRIKLLLELNDELKLPLEPVGYTIEEFSEMLKKGNRFILRILEEGEILHASERMMKIFQRIRGSECF
ncbi:MAG: nucleotidyltransferase domain-containing protein [Nitrososphaerota archaeon]